MGDLINMLEFIDAKISMHRDQMQMLMLESRLLVDLAVDSKYDFGKIAQARDVLNKAVWHSNEIKRLEKISSNAKHKKIA